VRPTGEGSLEHGLGVLPGLFCADLAENRHREAPCLPSCTGLIDEAAEGT